MIKDYTDILIQLRKIIRSINLESKRVSKTHGLSTVQLLCLSFLKSCSEFKATQTEIKKYLKLNSSTVSALISKLESLGYVARLPKSGDKRTTLISLTSNGSKIVGKVPPVLHEKLSQNLEKLCPSELEEIKNALNLLTQLMGINNVEASPLVILEEPEE